MNSDLLRTDQVYAYYGYIIINNQNLIKKGTYLDIKLIGHFGWGRYRLNQDVKCNIYK